MLRRAMCFDPLARAPTPPRTGHFGASDRLVLTADDGASVAARLARSTHPASPGVVILPDVRGLHPYYEDLADRFADAGAHAIAIDFYGRTAGAEYRDASFDYAPHRAAVTDEHIRTDVRAARAVLAQAGATRLYALGFCFGGRGAFKQASQPGVDGVIGFYGWPARGDERGASPIDEARAGIVKAPVLAIYGGADQGITPEQIQAYDSALDETGVPHETVVYPGAPHSFFDRRMNEHGDACVDAWTRVLRFVGLGES